MLRPRCFAPLCRRLLVTVAVSGLMLSAAAANAATTPEQSCQATVATSGLKYFASALKALSTCERGRSDGSIPVIVNCRPSVGPIGDLDTDAALVKAQGKLNAAIAKKCAAANVSAMTFGRPCTAVTDVATLTTCIRDDAEGANAENLVETVFDDTAAVANPGSLACQTAVSKAAAKYAQARAKIRSKCAKAVTSGKTEGPCPDAKANASLDKELVKFKTAVGKKCDDASVNALTLGFPCDQFTVATFDRLGNTSGNALSTGTRFQRCLAAAVAGAGDLGAQTTQPLPDQPPFSYGVAAGDETDVAFIAWTRSTNAVDPVTLEVASDAAFTTIVDTQVLGAPDAAADSTVHGEATGLTASTQYYYRFTQAGSTSRVGRVKTAPAAGSTDPFTFAFTGDANAFFRPFAVLEQITKANPDVWLFIGDTIYGDDARSGSGVATVRSDYHTKYRENRDDRAIRDIMASIGVYTIWDDHEVTNDFWGTDPTVQTQMIAGNEAFRDYMPMRPDGGDPMRLYRSFRWGDVAEFFLIDARQYRSSQADITESAACVTGECSVTNDSCKQQSDCDPFQLGQLCHKGTCSVSGDLCSVQADCLPAETCDQNQGDTVPNATCQAEIDNPARTYLGATQLAWLKNGLQTSPAKFKFVMNGPLITELLFVPYDRWEGYSAERQDLLDYITTNTIKNVIFLSTDIHGAIINNDVSGSGVKELVAGAIGMDPILRELPADVSALVANLPLVFPTVTYYDIDRFNVTTATVSQTKLDITWLDGSGQVLKKLTVNAQ